MVEFITIQETEIKFGDNNFIEVAHKKAVCSKGEKHFTIITRGYFTPEKTKKFIRVITLPMEEDALKKIIDALTKIQESV